MDIGIFVLRIGIGLTLAAHGAQKLFGWFGGPGRTRFASYLESLGFRHARTYAWIAGLAEFAGGLLLAFGLLTPLAVAAIIGMMLTASVVVHARHGFFNADGGFELPAILAVAAATIAVTGPGAYALDSVLGLPLTGPAWAAAGIALGILAAGVVVALRWLGARRRRGTVQPQAA